MLVCFACCAWAPKAAHRDIRSLGLIISLGDTCMFEHVANSPLEWLAPPQATFLEVSDWGIDDDVMAALNKQLGMHYSLQKIAVEHQDFDTWTHASLARHIRDLPIPEKPVDAYLLVLRDWRSDEIGGSNHQVGGLGLYRRDLPDGGEKLGVFASYRILLLDPDTGNVIAERAAVLPTGRTPWFPASGALWPRTQNDLTETQSRELKANFLKLTDATLASALRGLMSP